MKKLVRWSLLVLFGLSLVWTISFLISTADKSLTQYKAFNPYYSSIEKKLFIAGKVVSQNEIMIKPQISGIIEKVYLTEGAAVKKGDLIATIKVVPNEQALYQARGRVKNAKIAYEFAEIDFNRNEKLYSKGVIAEVEFLNNKLAFDTAKLELENAKNDYQIILNGYRHGVSRSNTRILSPQSGTLMEIFVKKGEQVIQSNNFNDGTTIATISDLTKMSFEGKVNEGKVGKLKLGMPLEITLAENQEKKMEAVLKFIALKSVEESSYVQFEIVGDIQMEDGFFMRSGYSANASLTLGRKDSVLVIPEALLQFDKTTNYPFVEVAVGEREFERRDIEIGISNGIITEVVSGLTINDKVKQWHKTEPIKTGVKRKQKPTLD